MDKFFSIFGKLALVVVVGGGLIAGGFYLGKKFTASPSLNAAVSPTPGITISQTQPTAMPTQASQATGRFAVSAGGIKPFSAYTLSGVAGWTPTRESNASLDKLILTKGGYSIVILQAAVGGGGCSFPGTTPGMMSVELASSTDIPMLSGAPLRRGQTQSPTPTVLNFTVCQKASDGSFGTITSFGVINYTTPSSPDASLLAEMDAMIGSLQSK